MFTSNFFEHLPDKESLRRTLPEAFRFLPYTMALGFNPPAWTLAVYIRMPLLCR